MSLRFALWLLLPALFTCHEVTAGPLKWRELGSGVHYSSTTIPATHALLHVVRIDPRRATLRFLSAACSDSAPRTAAEWCKRHELMVAVNLGMYQVDHLSNVGHARCGTCMNNRSWNSYRSALVFRPKRDGFPSAEILDLDEPGARERSADYECVIQNLRLLKGSGKNVWSRQPQRWSESAIAQDRDGNILFLFCKEPFAMWDFCRLILELPLGIEKAMHVEGGPEASLSIHAAGLDLDLNGSYETGFREDSDSPGQWPIPNVIGVARP